MVRSSKLEGRAAWRGFIYLLLLNTGGRIGGPSSGVEDYRPRLSVMIEIVPRLLYLRYDKPPLGHAVSS